MSFGEREEKRESERKRQIIKKRDVCVNNATLHVELHHSQMYCAFDFHNWIDGLFSELVSHFSLKVKITKPLRMLLNRRF
jgi:hypothetical protein